MDLDGGGSGGGGVVDGRRRTRIGLKERFGFRGFGCCGATWGFGIGPTTVSVRDDDERLPPPEQEPEINVGSNSSTVMSDPTCMGPETQNPRTSGMNLAAALAAERQFREASIAVGPSGNSNVMMDPSGTPLRVSLMRLLEETTDMCDGETGREKEAGGGGGGGVGNDTVCCVCMVRKKGAAFIPCGHTYCRVCSRELWLNRGSCPLCNRSILEILDIF